MIVEVTNITDGPGRTPTQVDLYNKILDPGGSLKLPAELIDSKVRKLEERGLICIGPVPPWYASAKMRVGRSLTMAEMQKCTPPAPVKVEPKKDPVAEPSVEELEHKRNKR